MKWKKQPKMYGKHFELMNLAYKKILSCNFAKKGGSERYYENTLTTLLETSHRLKNTLITQSNIEEIEKITQADFFAFRHRPDVTIGKDGTAIELKVVKRGLSVREAIGQAIFYRHAYRYVILVLLDMTKEQILYKTCKKRKSPEAHFLNELARQYYIFTIIAPHSKQKNIGFNGGLF